jgi:hypothetical protein
MLYVNSYPRNVNASCRAPCDLLLLLAEQVTVYPGELLVHLPLPVRELDRAVSRVPNMIRVGVFIWCSRPRGDFSL